MSSANPENLTKEEKIELIKLLCKLQGQDMYDLGYHCSIQLVDFDLGPEVAGHLNSDYHGGWYYSDGSCYPNSGWARANDWDY